jgi:hypothetical protein
MTGVGVWKNYTLQTLSGRISNLSCVAGSMLRQRGAKESGRGREYIQPYCMNRRVRLLGWGERLRQTRLLEK